MSSDTIGNLDAPTRPTMRTRRGFARHFVLLGAIFATGLLFGGAMIGVRTSAAPVRPQERFVVMEGPRVLEIRRGRMVGRSYGRGSYESVTFHRNRHGMWATHQFPASFLPGAVFTECDLRGADLSGLDLGGCRFSGCDLTGSNLYGANLTGVRYTSDTQWPAGFDPKAHGARLEQ